jgi:hypothetical protein
MLPVARRRLPPAGPDRHAAAPAGLPGIAGNRPIWSILPAGLGGVASGTLLPVIRPPTRTPTPTPRRPAVLPVALPVALLVAALTTLPVTGASALPVTPPVPTVRPAPPAPTVPAPSADARRCPRDGFGCPQGSVVHGVGRLAEASIVWRRSRALGRPNHGRLVHGVELPAAGAHFVTVDPVTGKGRNPAWRRYGTDRLVRVLVRVAAAYAAAHPDAPRLVVGDLSRPHGGRFGRELGGDGHRSHQNGLDADVFYPRRDGLERVPTRVGQVDRGLAQDLVDRFVRAGARYVFVGPRTRLRGPAKVVMALANHDDHLHVRIRPGPRR